MADPGRRRPPRERLEFGALRFLTALPKPLRRLLVGAPVWRDGLELELDAQLVLRLRELARKPSFEELGVAGARAAIVADARSAGGPPLPVADVRSLELPGPAGPIPARLYVPEHADEPSGLLVFFHGGGWVIGDLDSHDAPCRLLARAAGVRVMSVDYRLAPEHAFPAAADDALAAFRYAVEHGAELGADPAAIAVGGDSAGGNLAAVVSQMAQADGGATPAFQLLVYPVTDLSEKRESYRLFPDGFLLTESQMDWYRGEYLGGDEEAARDPRASPLLATELAGLPPAYVAVAGFDPLRDEGEAYAHALRAAGVPVALRRHRGLVHGFFNLIGVEGAGRDAVIEAAGALRVGLARGGAR